MTEARETRTRRAKLFRVGGGGLALGSCSINRPWVGRVASDYTWVLLIAVDSTIQANPHELCQ